MLSKRKEGGWADKTAISITLVCEKQNELSPELGRSSSLEVFQTDRMSTCDRVIKRFSI